MSELKDNHLLSLFPGIADKQWFKMEETGEYWFHATGVCNQLGYNNVSRAVQLHTDEDERFQEVVDGRAVWFVSESGCYGLAMANKGEIGKKFKRWLKHEVLPKLRQSGAYVMPTITTEQQLALINTLITDRVNQTIQAVNDLAEMTTITAGRMKLKRRIATNLKYANNEKFPKDIEEELETLVQSGYSAEFFQSSIFSKIMTWADGVNQDANGFYQSLLSEANYAERQRCYRENRGRLEAMIDTFTHKKADEAIRNNKAKMTSLRELEQYVEN